MAVIAACAASAVARADSPPADMADMLNAHNERRSQHCVPPLTWSSKLAKEAQAYADQCILYEHGSDGENLANWVTIQNNRPVLPAASDRYVFENAWYCEIKHYDFANPKIAGGFKKKCDPPVNGHFTQVVWRNTRQVGCARATCDIGGTLGTNWVCRYSPSGNNPSSLAENVAPLCTGGSGVGYETRVRRGPYVEPSRLQGTRLRKGPLTGN